jgi:hypothetical protein
VILSLPTAALANVGTPLMWTSAIHLVFANAFIGIIEGLVLVWLFRIPVTPAIGLMILANYFSTWVGYFCVIELICAEVQFDLYNAWQWIGAMALIAYILTVQLEWPFVVILLWKSDHWIRNSVLGNLVVQTASYTGLFLIYWNCSGTSLYTEAKIVSIREISLPQNVTVAFISDDHANVDRIDLGSGRRELIHEREPADRNQFLAFEIGTSRNSQRQLVVYRNLDSGNEIEVVKKLAVFSEENIPRACNGEDPTGRSGAWRGVGDALRLGEMESDWTFKCGFWPVEGLSGVNSRTNARIRLSLETPIVGWEVRHVTQLPNDLVLFQLGERQICLFDPETRRVALLAYGRSPVAFLKSEQSSDVPPNRMPTEAGATDETISSSGR